MAKDLEQQARELAEELGLEDDFFEEGSRRILEKLKDVRGVYKPAGQLGTAEERVVGKYGYTLFREPNAAGGHTYTSDEIGGGVLVWDTVLVGESTLLEAMRWEHEKDPSGQAKKQVDLKHAYDDFEAHRHVTDEQIDLLLEALDGAMALACLPAYGVIRIKAMRDYEVLRQWKQGRAEGKKSG